MDSERLNPVGMTQGAKKRAAQLWAVAHFEAEKPRTLHRSTRRFAMALWRKHRTPEHLRDYPVARARYRVGQKLRACPGCFGCNERYRWTISTYILRPWGWPISTKDPFKHCDIPSGTPCVLLASYESVIPGGGWRKVRFGNKLVRVERQYVVAEPTRLCDGSGTLPTRRR